MNRWLLSLRLPRVVLSLTLVLWVGGVGCLAGCENMAMAALDEAAVIPLDNATVVAGESCAMAASHSCCAKHRGSSRQQPPARKTSPASDLKVAKLTVGTTLAFLLPTSGDTMHTCPLAMNAGALAGKASTNESSISAVLSPVGLPAIDTGLTVAHPPPPAWYSNRGHTYLRCCVFLI